MIQALVSLQRLWYLILLLSTICLVADITLSSTQAGSSNSIDYKFFVFPLALAADVPTVLIFAYCIWGKSNPFLLPSSSPKSNVCTRCVRGTGSLLLVCLWIANTILYSVSQVVVRQILAGVAAMIAILILVEMIGSGRLGRQQRWFLKQERRRQEQAKLDLEGTGVTSERSAAEQRKDAASGASAGLRGKGGGRGRGWGMDSREGLMGDTNSAHDDGVGEVEIVRPPSVEAAQVIFNQQLMYEMYQRQYHQHHQQFLLNQQPLGMESNTTGFEGAQEEGKYDDQLLESSFKFEIPMDEPLKGPPPGQTSTLESLLVIKKAVIHPPSAPTFERIPPPSTEPFATWPNSSATSQNPSSAISIQQDTIRSLNDSNPFVKGGECVAIQEVASAPPIESSSNTPLPPSPPSSQVQLDSVSRSTVIDPE
ncbi:hypothetical protein EC968_000492 [Mortierella alpina]|nr:hypothetical protein EC968_000492 [Mortierella alpina]